MLQQLFEHWFNHSSYSHLTWTLIHFIWVGAVIGVASHLIRIATVRLSCQLRYLIACTIFLTLAIAPLIIFSVINRQTPQIALFSPRESPQPQSFINVPGSNTDLATASVIANSATSPDPALAQTITLPFHDRIARHLVHYLPLYWLIGSLFVFALLMLGFLGVSQFKKQSLPIADTALLSRFYRLRKSMRISSLATLHLCEKICTPIVIGIIRPMILLPPSALSNLSFQQLEMILIHELAHVKRMDNLINLLQRLVEAFLYFHPSVWLISRWVRLEREHCCDRIVLQRHAPARYARTLTALVMPQMDANYALVTLANHQLLSRIKTILNTKENRMSLSRKSIAFCAAAIVGAFGIVFAQGQDAPASVPATTTTSADTTTSGLATVDFTAADAGTTSSTTFGTATFYVNPAKAPSAEQLQKLRNQIDALQKSIAEVTGSPTVELQAVLNPYTTAVPINSFALSRAALADAFTATNATPFKTVPVARSVPVDTVYSSTTTALPAAFLNSAANVAEFAAPQPIAAWSPQQALGQPDVPKPADDPRAWASVDPESPKEFLHLTYATPVNAAAIMIYESFNPGAISRVTVIHDQNRVTIFEGKDPTAGKVKGVLILTLKEPMVVSEVHIELACDRVQGWNEIDAVALLDSTSGNNIWASSATASSYFGQPQAAGNPDESQRIGKTLLVNPTQTSNTPLISRANSTNAVPRENAIPKQYIPATSNSKPPIFIAPPVMISPPGIIAPPKGLPVDPSSAKSIPAAKPAKPPVSSDPGSVSKILNSTNDPSMPGVPSLPVEHSEIQTLKKQNADLQAALEQTQKIQADQQRLLKEILSEMRIRNKDANPNTAPAPVER